MTQFRRSPSGSGGRPERVTRMLETDKHGTGSRGDYRRAYVPRSGIPEVRGRS